MFVFLIMFVAKYIIYEFYVSIVIKVLQRCIIKGSVVLMGLKFTGLEERRGEKRISDTLVAWEGKWYYGV